MNYECGKVVVLGDEVLVHYTADNQALARVVAIGLDLVAESIDPNFYSWAKKEGLIDESTVVVEWIDQNPFSHDDPNAAPVGNYMTLDSMSSGSLVRRGVIK